MSAITAGTWTALRETGLDPNDPYWAIRSSVVHHCYDGRPYLALIAICGYESVGPQEEANARLIAASPDLLTACESLIDIFGYVEAVCSGGAFIPVMLGVDWRKRLADARAAVGRAMGTNTAPASSSVGVYSIVTDLNDPYSAIPLDLIAGGMAEGGDGE